MSTSSCQCSQELLLLLDDCSAHWGSLPPWCIVSIEGPTRRLLLLVVSLQELQEQQLLLPAK